ncbi:hypothetical protein PEX2_012490 [Penicillium expansum]|uniref:Uncharacterized protein n=1 Tax=Penicillium expansum TaxID=27334 RepID=A0A0A2K5R8_PENEN|nr:hypothetical protein PEX2_012490 [Penicillium expansum]KGO62213.1 hypothetical protein PEX2_012490 [Penicillium expansum]
MKEKQSPAPQTPPSTAGSMDAPETIPPLLSCNEHSELNQAASPKTGDQSTRTLPDFSLGSPSFESLIFSEEVSQMESWLPDIAADCFQNDMNPHEILSKPEAQDTNRASDPMNMRSREDPQNSSSTSYKPVPSGTFTCPSPQSNESSPFSFTIPITTGPSLNTQSYISQKTCSCFSTLSHHLCTLQATSSTPENSQALDTLLIQSQKILPSIRNTVSGEHDPIPTPKMDARLDLYMRDALHFSGDPAWVVEVFGGTVNRVGFGEDGAYLGLQARNFQMEVRGLMNRIPKYG